MTTESPPSAIHDGLTEAEDARGTSTAPQAAAAGRVLRAIAVPLDSDATAPMRARRAARGTLKSWGLGVVADDMVVIVSELVTNAVQHGTGPIVIVLRQCDDTLLVKVADASPHLPEFRSPTAEDQTGRGLSLVQALSDDWGCRTRGGHRGKWVWSSRALDPDHPGPCAGGG
ncbi:ATP-binding protein [Streptomyces smaragdinus]|uniref:ATP-binding protein n=1 Tax=Streptomyces smaragdinus TaxID=2585196 RepID=UPI001294D19E|nr:ATP-binding protein [Streptomyces smaragdinus]